jgi:membrane protein implicated in regulation of membrane protease activity
LLFQIPGWSLAAVVLSALWYWKVLPQWLALACFIAWVLKDFLFYPFVRVAYETGPKTGAEALVGEKGIAASNLAPEGYVRVRGELWKAVVNPGNEMIASGTQVVILAAEGMKLRVRATDGD